MAKKSDTNPEKIFRCLLLRVFRWKDFTQQQLVHGVGKPDFILGNIILEVYGCYWHGCPRCYPRPLNAKMAEKIEKDRARTRAAHDLGYRLEVFWECDLYKDPDGCLARLKEIRSGDPTT